MFKNVGYKLPSVHWQWSCLYHPGCCSPSPLQGHTADSGSTCCPPRGPVLFSKAGFSPVSA